MIWSTVLKIECDRLKLVIMGHFLPFYPHPRHPQKTPKNQNFEKKLFLLEISSFYKCTWKTTIIWGMVPEIWSETYFLSFWFIFLPFIPLTNQKIKILKKWKKFHETRVSKTKIMMYASWEMEHDWRNFLPFWAIFCLLPPLEIKISKKC